MNRRDFLKILGLLCLGDHMWARSLHGKDVPAKAVADGEGCWTIVSDSHIGYPGSDYTAFIQAIEKEKIKVIVHVGDAINKPGSGDEWRRFFEITGPGKKLHLVPGNHDIRGEESLRTYLTLFPEPYYSFSEGDTLFVILCTEFPGEEGRIAGKQLAWVATELQRPFPYKFVFLHEPLFGLIPGHGLNRHPETRDHLHRLFVENGVSLVVAGHDHIYDRKTIDGITYVIDGRTGGIPVPGGIGNGHPLCYTLATRKKDGYSFTVREKDGTVTDRFSLSTVPLAAAQRVKG